MCVVLRSKKEDVGHIEAHRTHVTAMSHTCRKFLGKESLREETRMCIGWHVIRTFLTGRVGLSFPVTMAAMVAMV